MPEPVKRPAARPIDAILGETFPSVTAITFYTPEDQAALADHLRSIAGKLSIRGRSGFVSPYEWNHMCNELEAIADRIKQAAAYG